MGKHMSAINRQEQILEGAMQIFAQKGFRGTTTREIARAVGISEALMFKYFPTKEVLYRAIIQNRMDGTHQLFFPTEAVEARDDRQVFQSIASYLIRQNSKDPSFLRLFLFSALEGHELSRMFIEHYVMERSQLLSQYIRDRIRENGYRKVPPLLASRAFIGMIINYVISQEIYGLKSVFPFPPEKVVDTFVDIFLNGLQKNDKKWNRKPKNE